VASIRARLADITGGPLRQFSGRAAGAALADLRDGTTLSVPLQDLAGRSVLIAARDQFAAGLSLIELDGIARRIVIATPDLAHSDLTAIGAKAEVEAVVSDCALKAEESLRIALRVHCDGNVRRRGENPALTEVETEWVLLTSGTTGTPKMVVHTFSSLTAPIRSRTHYDEDVVWGTFYDIRRYGGLQIFLRFLLGRGSMVVGSPGEPQADYLRRLGLHGVTHLTGTPTHWRRALMCPELHLIKPRYVRLSGEIADQGILNALRAFFPDAAIGHAFASTEAGVGFEVDDGLEGFPVSILDANPNVQMKVENGCLWFRSSRTATSYLGEPQFIAGDDGFVDTGDLVEQRGDRFYFLGRRSGVINVGGNKVHPEEVESVINRHAAVRMSVVKSKRNPIMGALVVADIVLASSDGPDSDRAVDIKREILQICREKLAPYKIPVTIRVVPAIDVAAAGKLARHES